jgi:hypothetical protein
MQDGVHALAHAEMFVSRRVQSAHDRSAMPANATAVTRLNHGKHIADTGVKKFFEKYFLRKIASASPFPVRERQAEGGEDGLARTGLIAFPVAKARGGSAARLRKYDGRIAMRLLISAAFMLLAATFQASAQSACRQC